MAKDPTETTERKTAALLKKSHSLKDATERLLPHRSRPPMPYGLPEVHNDGVPLKPTASTIATSINGLAKYLAGLLCSHLDLTPHHVSNSRGLQTLSMSAPQTSWSVLMYSEGCSASLEQTLMKTLPCPDVIIFLAQKVVL